MSSRRRPGSSQNTWTLLISPPDATFHDWIALLWYTERVPRTARSWLIFGWTYPVSSIARDCRTASPPFQTQSILKRVTHLGKTGFSRRAVFQLRPPSKDTSTRFTRPRPDHARPVTLWNPLSRSICPPEGEVMTDLHSWIDEYWRWRPSGMRST